MVKGNPWPCWFCSDQPSVGSDTFTDDTIDGQIHQALAAVRASSTSTLAHDVAENGAVDIAINHCSSGTQAVSQWYELGGDSISGTTHVVLSAIGATKTSADTWMIDATETELDLFADGNHVAALANLHGRIHHALRADSEGAPSTHADVLRLGEPRHTAERKEVSNHIKNGSWKKIKASEKPYGRRVHKMVWVYKFKRDDSTTTPPKPGSAYRAAPWKAASTTTRRSPPLFATAQLELSSPSPHAVAATCAASTTSPPISKASSWKASRFSAACRRAMRKRTTTATITFLRL
jgi:hypothetical protein